MDEVRTDKYTIAFKTVTDPHDQELERLLCADHTVIFIAGGSWDVSLEAMEFSLHEGSVLLKRAGEALSLTPCRGEGDSCILAVGVWGRIPMPRDGAECFDLYPTLEERPLGSYNICPAKKVSELGIRIVFWNLMNLHPCGGEALQIHDRIAEWVWFLLVALRRSLPDIHREHETTAQKIVAYVNDHVDEDLTARHLGNLFYLSPNHLNAVFKKETGVSLHQYIITRRVEMANLLMDQGMPVTEVAARVGYKSYQGFYQAYEQVMNMSPADYVNQRK